MRRTIKVHRLAMDGTETKEVNLQEAKRIVAEAYAHGGLVVNKKVGEVIDELASNVEEILIVEAVAGG